MFNMCQFLLTHTCWPDKRGAMLANLKRLMFTHGLDCTSLYTRLFIEQHGLDIAFDEMSSFLSDSPPEIWDIVRKSQPDTLWTASLPDILGFLIDSHRHRTNDPIDLSKIMGLDIFGRQIAKLRDRRGRSALHLVARTIHYVSTAQEAWADLWIEFGIFLIRNGADPHEFGDGVWQSLLAGWFTLCNYRSTMVRFIKLWARMLHTGGINLLEYGKAEVVHYRRNKRSFHQVGPTTYDLLYGPHPDDWGLKVQERTLIELYTLVDLPGAFPQSSPVPRTINWYPSQEEKREGEWRLEGRSYFCSSPGPAVEYCSAPENSYYDPVIEILKSTQDDTSMLSLVFERERHERARKRCHSQPPSFRHRKEEHNGFTDVLQCLFDGKYRWSCSREFVSDKGRKQWPTVDLRRCVEGHRSGCDEIHKAVLDRLDLWLYTENRAREREGQMTLHNPFSDGRKRTLPFYRS